MLGTCPFLSKETKYIFITILQVRQNASSEIFLRKARFVVLEGKFNLKIKLSWVWINTLIQRHGNNYRQLAAQARM